MSLFVGNISKKLTKKQFEDTFRSFGRCRIDLRVNNQSSDKQYAFVQFDNQRDAEKAKNELHNSEHSGLKFNIQWSKSSGRFGENGNRRGNDRGDGGRGRRDDRQRSWGRRRQRSISRQKKRDSPDYTQDLQAPPLCKRDIILLQKLLEQKRVKDEIQDKQRQNSKKEPQMQVQN